MLQYILSVTDIYRLHLFWVIKGDENLFKVTQKRFYLITRITTLTLTTALMSFALTLLNRGIDAFQVTAWLKAWLYAFVAIAVLNLFLPKTIISLLRFIMRAED